jgi:predicted amidophosphoribosyltransferase
MIESTEYCQYCGNETDYIAVDRYDIVICKHCGAELKQCTCVISQICRVQTALLRENWSIYDEF